MRIRKPEHLGQNQVAYLCKLKVIEKNGRGERI
jgi:hypothetical protein